MNNLTKFKGGLILITGCLTGLRQIKGKKIVMEITTKYAEGTKKSEENSLWNIMMGYDSTVKVVKIASLGIR